MLIRWKNKDKDKCDKANQKQASSNSLKKKRKYGRDGGNEEGWNSDSKSKTMSSNEARLEKDELRSRGRNVRREDPRRHTLGGDQHYLTMAGQGGPLSRTMDLEGQPRGYGLHSNAMLFDDDPGIMSEVETSSTGFRRGGKQRSSLPVVRTPSKTLERPLGLVFLQYRNETKRALLPNEITSIDTVKALFVRSFPKQLTMEYLDSPNVKIYIHDSSKDMFYELEDLRSHLREIRDRSVLRLFESADVSGGLPMAGIGIAGGVGHFEDPSYFSEPEFDSEYQHQHIHKSKGSGKGNVPYYMGSTASLTRGSTLLRTYSPAIANAPQDRLKPLPTDGYMSSPERSSRYEDPYYSQYTSRSGSITPVIDEEVSDTELLDDSYSLYGVKLPPGAPRTAGRPSFPAPAGVPYDQTRKIYQNRLRVENMERQLANLTGLVQKALTQPAPHIQIRDDGYKSERDRLKPAPVQQKCALSPSQYDNRIYRDLLLTPEMYNQFRGLQKKAKDLRVEVKNLRRMSQAQAHSVKETIRDAFIKIRAMLIVGGDQIWQTGLDQDRIKLTRDEDLYKQEMLRLENDLSDLETTVEELRSNVINRKTRVNMSDVENMALVLSKSSKTVADLKLRFPGLQDGMKTFLNAEMEKVMREEKFLKEEPERLESALRRCKKLTGTLVTLKRLASVQEQRLPCPNSSNDEAVSPTPETPITPTSGSSQSKCPLGSTTDLGAFGIGGGSDSGASDHNQRPENALDALLDELQTFAKPHPKPQNGNPAIPELGRSGSIDSSTGNTANTLTVNTLSGGGGLRRLHSYPSGSDTDNSPPIQPMVKLPQKNTQKPPLPERTTSELSTKRVPPPPPPRTSSKSPLASPTSPVLPPRAPLSSGLMHIQNVQNIVENSNKPQSQFEQATQNLGLHTLRRNLAKKKETMNKDKSQTLPRNIGGTNFQIQTAPTEADLNISTSSSCESINSQDGSKKNRTEELEQRHQELLKKQKALQEQYARLQSLQRGTNTIAFVPPAPNDLMLKKTGSESNLLQKMGLQMSAQVITGSLTNLPNTTSLSKSLTTPNSNEKDATQKSYETDIL
ncbi:unnamed protein product [Brassicogethes aeneus]|uniref:Actin interacting protein 3-like C-terminal domain-containing protein n=1 Tax=Brassicogethes aeneus TaxID=1431903 RepID=A0A9P0FIG3_BRAAE|nr:unnamed protein product [Brassicogethes aeneus]